MGYLDLGNQEPPPPVPWEVSSVIDEPPRQWYSAAVARMDLRSQSRKEEAPELHLAFCQLHGIEGLSGSTLRSLLACMLTGDCTSVFCTLWTLCSGPPDPGATQESRLWKRASGNFNDENAIWGRILSLGTEFKTKTVGQMVYLFLSWTRLWVAGTELCRHVASLPFEHDPVSIHKVC